MYVELDVGEARDALLIVALDEVPQRLQRVLRPRAATNAHRLCLPHSFCATATGSAVALTDIKVDVMHAFTQVWRRAKAQAGKLVPSQRL